MFETKIDYEFAEAVIRMAKPKKHIAITVHDSQVGQTIENYVNTGYLYVGFYESKEAVTIIFEK